MAVSGSPEPGQSLAGHGEEIVAQTEKGAGQGHTVRVMAEAGVQPKASSRSAASSWSAASPPPTALAEGLRHRPSCKPGWEAQAEATAASGSRAFAGDTRQISSVNDYY